MNSLTVLAATLLARTAENAQRSLQALDATIIEHTEGVVEALNDMAKIGNTEQLAVFVATDVMELLKMGEVDYQSVRIGALMEIVTNYLKAVADEVHVLRVA